MNTRHRFTLAIGFVILSVVVSLFAEPSLPAVIVSNWDASGDSMGTVSKGVGLWLLPVLTAVLLVVFAIIPRIDPLRENIATFRPYYDWFVVIFAAYMFVLHTGIIAFNWASSSTSCPSSPQPGFSTTPGYSSLTPSETGSWAFGRRGR